jgi:pimeloyl-ACP methyl ester carboxylesterase
MNKLRSSGIACVLTLSLAACGDEDSAPLTALAPATAAEPAADTGAAPAELSWRSCGQFQDRNLECTEVLVPIDYTQPEGGQLPVALRRVQADPLEPYRGALLFNPGGPGGDGIEVALAFVENNLFNVIAPGYDIVGFDPRGVANSGEVGCGILPEDMYPGATSAAEPELGFAEWVAYFKTEGERCESEWGPLFRRLGSNNVVRDMEEIRKALNEPLLNFLGASYGTRLGALYAHNYPETTGRMVLDAAVPPRTSAIQIARGQFFETVELHELLLSACESAALPCPPDARLVFDQALANARQRELDTAFINTWTLILGTRNAPQVLIDLLTAEATDPGGEWILDFLATEVQDNSGVVAYYSVSCTDDNFEPPTFAELDSLRAEFREVSPLFAELFLVSTAACAGWPTTRDPAPVPTALDAPPLLVIGGRADARTPYEWSVSMTEALGNATLLTSEHYGHGAVISGSQCVLANTRAYLVSGSLPATGTICPSP